MRTMSTMSSSNYGNSENTSNIGHNRLKKSRSQIKERDILNECVDQSAQAITEQLKKLKIKEKEFNNISKDDGFMELKQRKKMYQKIYYKIIKGSNSLIKGDSMYSQKLSQIEEDDFDPNNGSESLLDDDKDSHTKHKSMFDNFLGDFSPIKSLNECLYEDLLSVSSDSKQQKFHEDMEMLENNSVNEDVMDYVCSTENNKRKCMSQSAVEEAEQRVSLEDVQEISNDEAS